MNIIPNTLGPRLLAGVGTLALLAAVGLFSSRPARTAGGPVPVTVANAPLAVTAAEGQAVEGFVDVSAPGFSASYNNLVYTVPAGKQLVVESMTLLPNGLGTATGYSGVVLNKDSGGKTVSLATLTAGPGVGALSGTTQPMRLHVGPGGAVSVNVFKTGAAGIEVFVSLSGHLEDVP